MGYAFWNLPPVIPGSYTSSNFSLTLNCIGFIRNTASWDCMYLNCTNLQKPSLCFSRQPSVPSTPRFSRHAPYDISILLNSSAESAEGRTICYWAWTLIMFIFFLSSRGMRKIHPYFNIRGLRFTSWHMHIYMCEGENSCLHLIPNTCMIRGRVWGEFI